MLDYQDTKNFGAYLDRTIKIIKMAYHKAFREAGIDLTTEQWVILSSLYDRDGQSQIELAEGSYKDATTVSRIIDLLCKKNLTLRERLHHDRRRYKVFITPEGRKTVENALPTVLELRQKGWEGLGEPDYEAFLKILDQITRNFESKEIV